MPRESTSSSAHSHRPSRPSQVVNASWISECRENYRACYEHIGGVDWLPGVTYLHPDAAHTQPYMERGLCEEGSALYNQAHCDVCQLRMGSVSFYLIMFVLVLEHILVLLKFVLAWGVPDTPRWVTRAEARQVPRRCLAARHPYVQRLQSVHTLCSRGSASTRRTGRTARAPRAPSRRMSSRATPRRRRSRRRRACSTRTSGAPVA